ncbi:hypothetical protein COU19_02105 [Candidatus Kaiserbacteria bacterium CG10_big_fil_rev_8_21_14_0_10_56_12]|uniref:O-antigen ligase-related domain-containing protein n=1 Tax=Candidatus Kaiserbacteria bacterium CG10_big_fil_rev_8_21_14_0_10_56_12 TaxID=1974611 RepID=A0A2H0U9P6_9BACT|nr:MAG: hypothetical protein COU19_02105 [Candidatus Kaiserbacteria bacterium CG10_big_fil_rev_8_21_14_0_10_56_12]
MQGDTVSVRGAVRWVALAALFFVPFTPLIISGSLFFPFITGKAFFFRILVEIAVVAWVLLAFLDAEYRPRFSWIGAVVVAFVAWMLIADLSATNVVKAFWSNFERMEGWMLLIHLLGFFFAASAVLRVEKKWRAWFLTSLGVGLIVAGYALFQLGGFAAIHQGSSRIDASFGNSAYLAIYFLFNVFIALWLALTERRTWLMWVLVVVAALDGVLIFFTETRGTVLGLLVALALAAFLTALTAGKRTRSYAAGALALIVVVTGGFYLARNSSLVQENHVLQRIASISLADGQTRFTIWGMALDGVRERPVLGWGQEGFNYVFNTYYEPSLYGQESWFDRAHNAFIDWLTAGGIPAFLLYVALFASAVVLLWRSTELSRPERIALTAVLVGYAIHNLFVFDNLYSYIYFFAVLALVDSQVGRPTKLNTLPAMNESDGAVLGVPIAAVVALVLVWYVNVANMQTAHQLIVALSPNPSQGVQGNISAFKDLLSEHSFAEQEIREQIVALALGLVGNPTVSDTDKKELLTLAATEMQKQVTAFPSDAREHLQLAYVYRAGGALKESLAEMLAAAKLSPRKEEIWVEAGAIEWDLGNVKAAREDFVKAYELGPQFPALAAYAAAGDIAIGDTKAADALLMSTFGTTVVDNDILAVAYFRTKNWPRLVGIWKLRAEKPGVSVQTWFSFAAAQYAAGQSVDAIRTINKAVELFPEAAKSGAAAIAQIRAGK